MGSAIKKRIEIAIEYELIEIAGLSALPIIAFKTGDKNWVMDKFIDVGINIASAVK